MLKYSVHIVTQLFKRARLTPHARMFGYKNTKSAMVPYTLLGAGTVCGTSMLMQYYQSQKNNASSNQDPATEFDYLRKQKLVASVYTTLGLDLSPNQVHIIYANHMTHPVFFYNPLSQSPCLRIVLPQGTKSFGPSEEAEFIALCAKQAVHDKEHHHLWITTISGGTAGLSCALLGRFARHPGVLMMSMGGMLSYKFMSYYLHQQSDYRADKTVVTYFPDYIEAMVGLMLKSQKNPLTLTDYHKKRYQKMLVQCEKDNKVSNRQCIKVSQWLRVHRRRFDPIKPEEHYPHPLARAYQKNGLHLNKKQSLAMERLDRSARVYLPEYSKPILQAFFELNKGQNTPLGELYRKMNFSDFIERLTTKTYKTIHLDGRILQGRSQHEDRFMKAPPNYANTEALDELNLVLKIGSLADSEHVFLDYLTAGEMAIKSLLIVQAVCLPIGDGRHVTRNSEHKRSSTFHLPVIESLQAAEKQPVAVAAVSGIEVRKGKTIHPDLLMIFVPKKPTRLWMEMTQALCQSVYYQVSTPIYGEKLALNCLPETHCEDTDFALFTDETSHEEWYVCKPAYKQRMKILYRGLLTTADQQMQEYGLGHSYNLKGLELGCFGFGSSAISVLETLNKDALYELLEEIQLKHIQQINWISWPRQLEHIAPECALSKEAYLQQINTVGSTKICAGIAESFSVLKEAGSIGGTHVCVGSGSQFGNEASMSMPLASSDEVAMYYALLNPSSLNAEQNSVHLRVKIVP